MFIKKKLRILHCPIVALYQPHLYVKGLRELGHQADYMVFSLSPNQWLARTCDFDLGINILKGNQFEKEKQIEFLIYALKNYDVFHFHSGYSLLYTDWLWNRLDDLKFLKRMGKKLIISWWGCDLRTEGIDKRYKYSACNECEQSIRNYCNSLEKKKFIEKAFKHIDIHLSNGDLAASYENITWIDNAIDCNEWYPLKYNEIPDKFKLPESDCIRIYHSFGNSEIRGDVKGTGYIKAAVERLQAEGYKVEFIFFDKVPNQDIKYYQAQADIVIDQLRCGWHGSTALECLSMGKAVITYIRPEVEAIIPHKHPLVNANIDNIYYVIKDMLDNPEVIKRIGQKSREYALEYHHYSRIAKQLESMYLE